MEYGIYMANSGEQLDVRIYVNIFIILCETYKAT